MNELKIFENPEFGKIRTVEVDGEPWFIGKDVAEVLGYAKPENALAAHVDEEDKTTTLIQGDGSNYKSKTTIINESGLYSLVLSSKLPTAKKFKRWVTSEVLPSIRKTGSYSMPKDYPSALRALADAAEQKLALEAENERQRQQIAEFQPIRQYVDTILESEGTLATSQIAADYGISARQLNKILHDAGKYKTEFQKYLSDERAQRGSVNHTFAGCRMILEHFHGENSERFEDVTAELLAYAAGAHHGLFDCVDQQHRSGFMHRMETEGIQYEESRENFLKYCAG